VAHVVTPSGCAGLIKEDRRDGNRRHASNKAEVSRRDPRWSRRSYAYRSARERRGGDGRKRETSAAPKASAGKTRGKTRSKAFPEKTPSGHGVTVLQHRHRGAAVVWRRSCLGAARRLHPCDEHSADGLDAWRRTRAPRANSVTKADRACAQALDAHVLGDPHRAAWPVDNGEKLRSSWTAVSAFCIQVPVRKTSQGDLQQLRLRRTACWSGVCHGASGSHARRVIS
jgi:hypothetical protein